jgi:hypothetical protein
MPIGVVYKIYPLDVSITEKYVGSAENFNRRHTEHKYRCNNLSEKTKNFELYSCICSHGGWDSWKMEPIESYEYKEKSELRRREAYWIRELKASLNLRIPGRSYEERMHDQRDVEKLQQKQYARENRTPAQLLKAQWTKEHAGVDAMHKRKYYDKNRESIAKKQTEKIACECGAILSRNNIPQHRNSDKHKRIMAKLQIVTTQFTSSSENSVIQIEQPEQPV